MNESVSLRESTADDIEFMLTVRRESFRRYVDMWEGWDDDQQRKRFVDHANRQVLRVITTDGRDVGYTATAVYATATDNYPAGFYVHQIMILPAFQSMGIGGKCMRLLFAEAAALRLVLRLRVLRTNPRALSFYLGLGMSVVSESESHFTLEEGL